MYNFILFLISPLLTPWWSLSRNEITRGLANVTGGISLTALKSLDNRWARLCQNSVHKGKKIILNMSHGIENHPRYHQFWPTGQKIFRSTIKAGSI